MYKAYCAAASLFAGGLALVASGETADAAATLVNGIHEGKVLNGIGVQQVHYSRRWGWHCGMWEYYGHGHREACWDWRGGPHWGGGWRYRDHDNWDDDHDNGKRGKRHRDRDDDDDDDDDDDGKGHRHKKDRD